ncbi:MAG: insulinase family protein [Kineosporiaceae bacterium]|nr:insulinase family protein [Kineosporiaceae bacterium]
MPHLRSATIGCWVGVGSRDEADGHHGSTHFLEHLLFKGTERRSAMDIATVLDGVGGEANAVTGKEYTCYYARVRDEDLPLAVDVLLDMVTSARLGEADVESERGVILEELAMNDDDPTDVVHERFAAQVMGAHPLGRPIGGTAETIAAVRREDILSHYRRYYDPTGLVITAAGGIDHDELCAQVARELARSDWSLVEGVGPRARRPSGEVDLEPPAPMALVPRGIEQANVVLGTTGLTATDSRRHVMSVLNAVLGGGMSSRLFQEIREARGLAYSVYSFATGYSDAGYFGLYAGCTPARVEEVIGLLGAQLDALAADGITAEELARAHGQLCGSLVLGLEDTGSRMTRLGKAELVQGEYLTLEESLRRVRAVTADDVAALAADLASRPRSLTVVGPFEADRTFEGG